jgi:outer membrane protein
MKKITAMMIIVFIMAITAYSVNAATVAYIDGQKIFLSYDKIKKAEELFKKKELLIQDEIEKKQKQYEKAKSDNMSDGDLRKLVEKFDKELAPKKEEITELRRKITEEIHNEIVKASDDIAKEMGYEVVLDKKLIITGGIDITDKVIKKLNK